MIVWREKARAFAIHFLITLAVCAPAAALVFLVWFPDPFHTMVGGTKLFGVLVACDLGLGPLTSFVIYSSKKPRRKLLFDYSVVGVIQLAAFCYGLYMLSNIRPVYIAYVVDRLEVVSAGEIDDADLAKGADGYRRRPLLGPQLVGAHMPEDQKDRQKILVSALSGKDISVLPAYFVPYEQMVAKVKQRAMPVSALEQRHPEAASLVANAAAHLQVAPESLVWLPVKHRKGFWTVLLDPETARPVHWLPLDPY